MRIYIFKSETRLNLRAFAGDITGSKLPERVGPWRLIRASAVGVPLPHGIARTPIERAITANGFQLWRIRAVTPAA